MKVKYLLVSLLMAQGAVVPMAMADNRGSADVLFDQPATAGGTQFLLGLAELIAAERIKPGMTVADKMLTKAESTLTLAQDLPTSEAQRTATISAINGNPANFADNGGLQPELKPAAARRIEALKSAAIVTKAEKTAAIEAAQDLLSSARADALITMQKMGALDKAVRVARYGTSLILVGDVVARIYIWNALDANPTISPAATYLRSLIK
jgi:hypothetical protein